jgi:hypothetical protein
MYPVYMELPAGVNPDDVSDKNCCQYNLKLNKSLYGLRQAGCDWFKKHHEGLIACNFVQSQVYKCVLFCKDCIDLAYVDDCIILGKTMADVDLVILLLQVKGENFQLINQGSFDKYLGLLIRDIDTNTSEMNQPFLICHILENFSLWININQKNTILQLENHYSTDTLMEHLANSLGNIAALLDC